LKPFRGPSYGPGEYFGLTFEISLAYAKGEQALIVVAILDGPWVSYHDTFLVVRNPIDVQTSYCLPLGVVILGSRVMQCNEYLACQYPIPAASELRPVINQLRDNIREAAPTDSAEGKIQLEKIEKMMTQFEMKMGFSRPSKHQLLETLPPSACPHAISSDARKGTATSSENVAGQCSRAGALSVVRSLAEVTIPWCRHPSSPGKMLTLAPLPIGNSHFFPFLVAHSSKSVSLTDSFFAPD
jgi:hypothetical protein